MTQENKVPISTTRQRVPRRLAQAGFVKTASDQLPHLLKAPLIGLNRWMAGLSSREISVAGHRLHYLDGGRGEPVLLLHGIFAEKDHWVDFARHLTRDHRVIVPDLPGFGESERHEDQRYGYAEQLLRLQAFLDVLALSRLHVAGSSMGGALGALLALASPERVASLAFIGAPHGLRSPVPSETDRLIDRGDEPLIARDAGEFESLLARLFEKRPWLPWPIRQAACADAIGRAESNRRLWQEHLGDRHVLDLCLAGVQTPLLALWGRRDRVFHVSGVRSLRRQRPDAEIEVLEGLGHLPMMEDPKRVAVRYLRFVGQHRFA